MPRISAGVSLADIDREQLERWVAAYGTPQQVALRCQMVLAAATGRTNLEIGMQLGVRPLTLCGPSRRSSRTVIDTLI